MLRNLPQHRSLNGKFVGVALLASALVFSGMSPAFAVAPSSWTTPNDMSALSGSAVTPQIVAAAHGTVTVVGERKNGINDDVVQSAFSLAAPSITSATPPAPQLDTAYSFQLTASGTPDSTFTVSSGALPSPSRSPPTMDRHLPHRRPIVPLFRLPQFWQQRVPTSGLCGCLVEAWR